MTQILVKKIQPQDSTTLLGAVQPIPGDLLDDTVRKILETLNGGLDVENIRRGVLLAAPHAAAAGIVPNAWLEPFATVTMQGFLPAGYTGMVMGVAPSLLGTNTVLFPYRASAILDAGTISPATTPAPLDGVTVTFSDTVNTLGTVTVTEKADGFAKNSVYLRKGSNKNFATWVVGPSRAVIATLPAGVALTGGTSVVSISFKVLHVP